jgi:hypothetical protein
MNAQAIAAIGVVVGGIAKELTASGLSGRWATVATFLVSAFVIWVWSISNGGIHQANAWDYLMGYSDVLGIAAGAFHIIENVPRADDAVNRLVGK